LQLKQLTKEKAGRAERYSPPCGLAQQGSRIAHLPAAEREEKAL
jgi:hypothetical protein